MSQSFEKELDKFDKERVLPAWDALISRQQAALDKLGVPSMFVSKEKGDREVCLFITAHRFDLYTGYTLGCSVNNVLSRYWRG